MTYQKGHPFHAGGEKGWFKKGSIPANSFTKGNIPWNKGHKGMHNSPDTEFKKGFIPWSKGKKFTEEHRKNLSISHKGKPSNRYKGGKYISTLGYIFVLAKDHPYAKTRRNYIQEHRLVMEKHLGRLLDKKEVVHHINENTLDNRIENLQLFPNVTAHRIHHLRQRKLLKTKTAPCTACVEANP